jgi:hypothetical protein
MKLFLPLFPLLMLCACSKEWTAEPANGTWEIVLQYESSIKKTPTTVAWIDTSGQHSELLPANTTGEYRTWQKRIMCQEWDTVTVCVNHVPSPSIDSGFTITIYMPMQSGRWVILRQVQIYNAPTVQFSAILPSKATYYQN